MARRLPLVAFLTASLILLPSAAAQGETEISEGTGIESPVETPVAVNAEAEANVPPVGTVGAGASGSSGGVQAAAYVRVEIPVPLIGLPGSGGTDPAPTDLATFHAAAVMAMGFFGYDWRASRWDRARNLCWAMFSRIPTPRLFENRVRERIYETVRESPGITLTEVARNCEIGWGTAVYHLARLESGGLLACERLRRRRHFFVSGGGVANGTKTAFVLLLSLPAQQLCDEVLQQPGLPQKEICARTGLRRSWTSKLLGRMSAAGIVRKARDAQRVRYFPTDGLSSLLERARLASTPRAA